MSNNMPPMHPEATLKTLVCGSCQWFSSGYNNVTCRKTRDVEHSTPACIEYCQVLDDPFAHIASDKVIIGIRDQLKSNAFCMDSSVLDEIKGYIISLNGYVQNMGKDAEVSTLNNTLRTVVAYRSRVSTIHMSCIDMKYDLNKLFEQAASWLFAKYPIMNELKSESIRQAAFNRILPEYVIVHNSLNKLIESSKYIDSKLDDNEKTVTTIINALTRLWFSKERG